MIRRLLDKLRHDNRGATAVEYGLIVSLIVVALVVGVNSLGGGTMALWGNVRDRVQNAS